MPPSERRRTILYLPRIVSSIESDAVAPSPAWATAASVIVRERISSRCLINFALARGVVVETAAAWSGAMVFEDSSLRELPPHLEHTASAKRYGHAAPCRTWLSRVSLPHSMQL